MSAMEHDFYELLGVERTADGATIKSAYRRLAMEYHPDRNQGCKENEAKFKAISAAYECLKDPQKRAAYDRYGHAAFQQGGGGGQHPDFADLGDIFETIFGSAFGGGGGRSRPRRGADMRYDMAVTLEDAFHGKSAPRRGRCRAPPPKALPKIVSKMSPRSAKSAPGPPLKPPPFWNAAWP